MEKNVPIPAKAAVIRNSWDMKDELSISYFCIYIYIEIIIYDLNRKLII